MLYFFGHVCYLSTLYARLWLILCIISYWQVSQLVILHEEAEKGRIVSDLVQPVTAVKAAVDNLVEVRETETDSIHKRCFLFRLVGRH